MTREADKRTAVLGAIRKALHVRGDEPKRVARVRERITRHERNLIPARAQKGAAERIALFTQMLEGQGSRVTRLKTLAALPEAIADYLREMNLPAEFRSGEDAYLASAPWEKAPSLTRKFGRAERDDAVGLSRAVAAAAETGTLFLASGPDNPTTLNFLPDTHIAVIRAGDILGSYEDAWDTLRALHGERTLPRTVNLISGASRTADIAQTIVMGAHGPRRLHVVIIDD
ncbi:MAG: lactate utilization protein [Methyloligellaceae bacterium]